jgi:hypothetical protein
VWRLRRHTNHFLDTFERPLECPLMLSYILAIAVGFGSVGLYLSAFFLPEIYRKYDVIWSGVGMFYALVLWVCAGRITGGVLVGQIASVSLISWFALQTLRLRRSQTPSEFQTPLPQGNSPSDTLRATLEQLKSGFEQTPGYSDWDRIQTQIGKSVAGVRGWIEAFVSTTIKPTEIEPTEVKPTETNAPELTKESMNSSLNGNGKLNLNIDQLNDQIKQPSQEENSNS